MRKSDLIIEGLSRIFEASEYTRPKKAPKIGSYLLFLKDVPYVGIKSSGRDSYKKGSIYKIVGPKEYGGTMGPTSDNEFALRKIDMKTKALATNWSTDIWKMDDNLSGSGYSTSLSSRSVKVFDTLEEALSEKNM